MKKRKLLSVLVAAALSLSCFTAVPVVSQAAEYTSGDFTYSLDGGCTITGYNGSATNVVIPSTLDGNTVLKIGSSAFRGKDIVSVTIPNTVQTINPWGFAYCSSLSNVDLGNSVSTLEHECFADCDILTSIDIPASMTTSGASADSPFNGCDALKTATIASGGVKIPSTLFFGCGSLQNVNIPEGIQSIGGQAFSRCTSLKEIKISNSVKEIGAWGFAYCSSLSNVDLGNSVSTLEHECFADCDILTSIDIPASMTTSGASADSPFNGCDALKTATIASGGVKIPSTLFFGCGSLQNVNIPEGIQSIGGQAFSRCTSLKEIKISNSVKEIGAWGFAYCSSLNEITLPESIDEIGEYVFDGCSSLTDFYDYSMEPKYPNSAFDNTTFLTIHGFEGSNAQKYANSKNITFVPFTEKQMYRLYNKYSGEHFYTSASAEKDNLVSYGWAYEGTAWIAPASSNTPVYRLYNPNSSEHHYTMKSSEKDFLVGVGWKDEGIGWYSDDNQGTPLYRLYNPNATGQYEAGGHHYTKDVNEKNGLIAAGWRDEGIGWYGI